MPSYLLGLDIGTSVTKAAIFDEAGTELAVASRHTAVLEPQIGWTEIDPDACWRAACDSCQAVLSKAGLTGRDIAGVGIAGVMIGAWPVDGEGAAIRPGILWNDGRAQSLVTSLRAARPPLLSEIFARSGSVMQLGCTLPIMAWLAQNEPETLARTRHVLTAKDYIRFRLTGMIGAEESDAAVAPGNAHRRDFDADLFELFGLGAFADLLPPVSRAETIAGAVTRGAALETALAEGTPVVFGTGDTPACVIGAGVGEAGFAATVLGTTCLNGVVTAEPVFEPVDLGLLFTVPGGLWMKTMVNVAGTTNIDWCLRVLCPDLAGEVDAHDRLALLAQSGGIGAGGVVYVPHLSSTGIIAPRVEAGARAGFFGIEPRHGRQHLVRALYEGVAYSIREGYAAIGRPIQTIRLSGGGAQSRFWSQMIADATGIAVEVPKGSQFGAKGAALLAGTGIGWYSSVREACRRSFTLDRRHEPEAAARTAYDAAFARYLAVSSASLDTVAPIYR